MRSLYQSPDHSVPSARAICKQGEKHYKRRKNPLAGVEMGVILLGAACLQIALALGTEWSGD